MAPVVAAVRAQENVVPNVAVDDAKEKVDVMMATSGEEHHSRPMATNGVEDKS